MKTIITTFIFSIITFIASAQLNAGDYVYLQFQDADGEVNVDGNNACEMLKSYVVNKTSLSVVSNKEEFDQFLSIFHKKPEKSLVRCTKLSKDSRLVFYMEISIYQKIVLFIFMLSLIS